MSPAGIVDAARARGINVLGICDHNSARNVPYVLRAALGTGVVILPGLEVCSREEVHVLTFFDTEEAALAMQEVVYARLEGTNNPDVFGMQVVANELGEVEGFEERLLIGATGLSIDEIAAQARALGGLVVPAHVDRQAYGLVGQLGFIPPTLDADALEISYRIKAARARETIPGTERFALVTGSDAHDLPDLGRAITRFYLETRSLGEVRMALAGQGGRRAEVD